MRKTLVCFVPLAALLNTAFVSSVPTSAAVKALVCSAPLTFTLHPGLPPPMRGFPIARDIPRGQFRVAAPLYPGATRLPHFVASPVPEFPLTPYLQTAVAEYQSSTPTETVKRWYLKAYLSCGWKVNGSRGTNASALTTGFDFQWKANRHLEMYMTFGDSPTGGSYIAYAAEEVTLPARPARSYLRGRFSQVRIAFFRSTTGKVVHVTIRRVTMIRRLITAINSLTDIVEYGLRHGGNQTRGSIWRGPMVGQAAWLSFVRPNGQRVHAWDSSWALTVNGTRALLDDGRVWNVIVALVKHPA